MMFTISDLQRETLVFLERHWPDCDMTQLSWKKWDNLVGTIPGGELQGVYALATGDAIQYIGVGSGRNPGRYEGAGLGARLKNRYIRLADDQHSTHPNNRRYVIIQLWPSVILDSVYTFPFPRNYGYLALSLEAYLIGALQPPFNRNRPGANCN